MTLEGHYCGPEPCFECGEVHGCICGNCMTTADPRTRLNELDPRSRLAAIRARAGAATEGPWTFIKANRLDGMPVYRIGSDKTGEDICSVPRYRSDGDGEQEAEFIAHARTEHPAMAAALAAVLDLLDRAEKAANHSPARMFGGAPFPAVLDADAIRAAITDHLPEEGA